MPATPLSNSTPKKNVNEPKFRYITPSSITQVQPINQLKPQIIYDDINFPQETLNYKNDVVNNSITTTPHSLNQNQSTSINSVLSTNSSVNKSNNNLVNKNNFDQR